MIDAFKPEYIKHAPYLQSLTKKFQHGELDMGFGHWRGVDILFTGNSNKIAIFYKNNNSLYHLKYFTWLKYFGKIGRLIVDILFNIPRLIKGYELIRTGNIPLDRLYTFDASVKKHPGKKVSRFYYFGELDRVGHKYGTKNEKIIKTIRKIDKKLSKMDLDLIFSDHGMIDIEKIISVPLTENCFIDSDMARYWGNKDELEEIREKLPLEHGRVIEWNKKYGDLIFLANPGVLFFPNFWNIKPVKAMHGYDGRHRELKAFYILKKSGGKKDLTAEELYNELKVNFPKQKSF